MKPDHPSKEQNSESLAAHRGDFDRMVLQTPQIDPFCSSSAWILSAHSSFMPGNKPVFFKLASGFAALCASYWPGWGDVLLPMEASWCLSCPLVGTRPLELAHELRARLGAAAPAWDAVLLAGLVENGFMWNAILSTFSKQHTIYLGPETVRCIARLDGGIDGFLGRRSAKFRGNIRAAFRKTERENFTFEYLASPMKAGARERVFSTMMSIEARSWKGLTEQGVNTGSMRDFYDKLLRSLAPTGRQRILIARHAGLPAGYIFGGTLDRLYRGFQFSFDARFASFALGNVLQLKMIERLSEEGVELYDLGTEIDYKRRWAEAIFKTRSLIIRH